MRARKRPPVPLHLFGAEELRTQRQFEQGVLARRAVAAQRLANAFPGFDDRLAAARHSVAPLRGQGLLPLLRSGCHTADVRLLSPSHAESHWNTRFLTGFL